jgi:hypothetical protein
LLIQARGHEKVEGELLEDRFAVGVDDICIPLCFFGCCGLLELDLPGAYNVFPAFLALVSLNLKSAS